MRGGFNQGLSREDSFSFSKFGDYKESFDRDQEWVRTFWLKLINLRPFYFDNFLVDYDLFFR